VTETLLLQLLLQAANIHAPVYAPARVTALAGGLAARIRVVSLQFAAAS
jgi:hypothetical protein